MKKTRHVLTLVFTILGVCYMAIGAVTYFVPAVGEDAEVLPIISVIFSALGAAFIVAAVLVNLIMGSRERRRLELLGYGRRVRATVLQVERNLSLRVNNRHPWRVHARCVHPLTGEEVTLRSHNVWHPCTEAGQTVEIVFDPMDEKFFVFDLPGEEAA